MRDVLARCGIITETFETAVTWDRFDVFHSSVQAATQAALNDRCGKGLVMWRFTHIYPDGPTIYYTVVGSTINQAKCSLNGMPSKKSHPMPLSKMVARSPITMPWGGTIGSGTKKRARRFTGKPFPS